MTARPRARMRAGAFRCMSMRRSGPPTETDSPAFLRSVLSDQPVIRKATDVPTRRPGHREFWRAASRAKFGLEFGDAGAQRDKLGGVIGRGERHASASASSMSCCSRCTPLRRGRFGERVASKAERTTVSIFQPSGRLGSLRTRTRQPPSQPSRRAPSASTTRVSNTVRTKGRRCSAPRGLTKGRRVMSDSLMVSKGDGHASFVHPFSWPSLQERETAEQLNTKGFCSSACSGERGMISSS